MRSLAAERGQIAKTVLLPGDPMRAQYIAERFLDDAVCYSRMRGMLGFTGTYCGKRVSVQGSGMGIPSSLIYINELITLHGVETIIRVGTAGAIRPEIKVRDIVLANAASTTSGLNKTRFQGYDFAPVADFSLLVKAYNSALAIGLDSARLHVGPVVTTDEVGCQGDGLLERYAAYGCLAVEMETAGLYTVAPKHGVQALSILTISDQVMTGEETTYEEQATSFEEMMRIALDIAE